MRYPNTRYGCPGTMAHYTQGRSIKEIAKHLKRSERTIKDWLEGKKKIPFWVPELLRLQHKEHFDMMREMQITPLRLKLGIVKHNAIILAFPTRANISSQPNGTSPPQPQPQLQPHPRLREKH